jgi:hypothetical protein
MTRTIAAEIEWDERYPTIRLSSRRDLEMLWAESSYTFETFGEYLDRKTLIEIPVALAGRYYTAVALLNEVEAEVRSIQKTLRKEETR